MKESRWGKYCHSIIIMWNGITIVWIISRWLMICRSFKKKKSLFYLELVIFQEVTSTYVSCSILHSLSLLVDKKTFSTVTLKRTKWKQRKRIWDFQISTWLWISSNDLIPNEEWGHLVAIHLTQAWTSIDYAYVFLNEPPSFLFNL